MIESETNRHRPRITWCGINTSFDTVCAAPPCIDRTRSFFIIIIVACNQFIVLSTIKLTLRFPLAPVAIHRRLLNFLLVLFYSALRVILHNYSLHDENQMCRFFSPPLRIGRPLFICSPQTPRTFTKRWCVFFFYTYKLLVLYSTACCN